MGAGFPLVLNEHMKIGNNLEIADLSKNRPIFH